MISLIPYRRVTFTTYSSVEEITQVIRSSIKDSRLFKTRGWVAQEPEKSFVGKVDSSTFLLRNVSNRVTSRRYGPVYHGKFVDNLDHRQVQVTARISWIDVLFHSLGVVAVVYLLTESPENIVLAVIVLMVGYAFTMLDFNIRSHNTLHFLQAMLQSQQV